MDKNLKKGSWADKKFEKRDLEWTKSSINGPKKYRIPVTLSNRCPPPPPRWFIELRFLQPVADIGGNWLTCNRPRLGSTNRASSSQQLQMWFFKHFFAPKLAALFVTPIVSATVEQIWREKVSEKPHSIRLLRRFNFSQSGSRKTLEKPLKELLWNQQ